MADVRAQAPGPQQQRDPGHAAAGEVGPDHRAQRPRLEVGALDRRVEQDRRPPSARQPAASSMSSIDGCGYRVASNPPTARKASRRIAPSPVQNVSAGPRPRWWTWWCSRLRKADTVVGARGVVVGAETAVSAGSAAKAARMPTSASGCTSTSASTNTITSPPGARGPVLRAPQPPRLATGARRRRPRRRPPSAAARSRPRRSGQRRGPVGSRHDDGEGDHRAGTIG